MSQAAAAALQQATLTDRGPLTERNPLLCLSLLAPSLQASAQSKKQKPGQYLPPKLRGETTSAVARRLIGAGLNMKGFSDKVDLHSHAKLARQHKKEQLDAAWGDD